MNDDVRIRSRFADAAGSVRATVDSLRRLVPFLALRLPCVARAGDADAPNYVAPGSRAGVVRATDPTRLIASRSRTPATDPHRGDKQQPSAGSLCSYYHYDYYYYHYYYYWSGYAPYANTMRVAP